MDSTKAGSYDDLGRFGQSLTGLRDLHADSGKGDLQDVIEGAEQAWVAWFCTGKQEEEILRRAIATSL